MPVMRPLKILLSVVVLLSVAFLARAEGHRQSRARR